MRRKAARSTVSLIEAQAQSETAAHFEGHGNIKARSLRDTGGIPTGADASLEAPIAKRKKATQSEGDVSEVRQ